MVMRQNLQDLTHFENHVDLLDGFKAKAEARIQSGVDEVHERRLKYGIYERALTSLVAKYTQGYPIDELCNHFQPLLFDLKNLLEVDKNLAPSENLEQYISCLWLLSFCYFFNAPKGTVALAAEHIPFAKKDRLTDLLIRASIPDHEATTRALAFPDVYQPLMDAIGLLHEPDAYNQKIQQFLEDYNPSLEKHNVTWYDSHKEKDPERCFHFGYWVFELSALLLSTNIFDDSAFRDHPFYPKDLADWKKERILNSHG